MILVIDKSPISDEDKTHWKSILHKMTDGQKVRLKRNLIEKTEVAKAISEIKATLDIISIAEKEAQEEIDSENKEQAPVPQTPTPVPMTQTQEGQPPEVKVDLESKENLERIKQENEAKLAILRNEIKQISLASHGQLPPSYQQ